MKEFTPSGFFVLRTPLFPFQEFLNFSCGLRLAEALRNGSDGATLSEAIEADLQTLRARLREFAHRPEVGEALLVASPEFSDSLSGWLKGAERSKRESSGAENSGRDKDARIEHTFYRYLARMTARPTPFGLFAGCSVGSIGPEVRLEIGPRGDYTRRSRLDMEYLYTLADKVAGDPALRGHLKFKPNTSLYMAAGRYHHAQGYQFEKLRLYRLVATEPTPYLDATLQRAAAGVTPACLAAALVTDDPEISPEEAEAYVGQLIESQLLTAELVPPITGPEPIDDMIAQLGRVETMPVSFALAVVRDQLQKLDSGGLHNEPGEYRAIVETIKGLPAEFQAEHLVQVDMMKPAANAVIDRRMTSEILRGVELLHSISAREHDLFRQFKSDFQERYQDQEIPLTLALDEEVGIGFERKNTPGSVAEPLIDDLDLAPARANEEEEPRSGARDFPLLRRVEELARRRETVLELDERLLKTLRVANPPPLPDAFAAMGTLGPPVRPGGRHSFHLVGSSGPSGAILLGRFCHADAALTDAVKNHMRAEEANQDAGQAVFAEIAHLPEGRVGNILFRPHLRKYEIPFLSTSRVPPDDRIPVTDLMVSVRGDRVVLRSRRLHREVLPRLTSAHGYTHGRNLKLYKFLCLLQTQGVSGGIAWNWGVLEHLAFLPRVTSGNIVLAAARWRLEKETLESLAKAQGAERVSAVDELRRSRGLPRFVLLAEADNQLLIDFDNVLSIETLVEYVKKRPSIRLVEMFPEPDALPAHGPEGAFTHEIVVPYVREAQTKKTAASAAPAIRSDSAEAPAGGRSFLPGSQWLFVKIHAGPAHVDRLLLETIGPLVKTVLAENEAEGWFFIRYADPRWHLRLRFRGDPARLTSRVLPRLWECLEPHAAEGRIYSMSLDTYEREIERYGGLGGMATSESLFQADSELALELLASIGDRLGAKVRWQTAFYSVNLLMAGLGLDFPARRLTINTMGRFQEKKFNVSAEYRKQVSDRFRGERQTLEKLLDDPRAGDLPESAISALELYAQRLKTIRRELGRQQQAGSLTVAIPELAGSYVHMHLNRMFRSAANAQEMVLYDYLVRTWDSLMAREKRKVS